MLNRMNPFRLPEHVVLSLEVQAHMPNNEREQSRFEVLVRHLLDRFLNNELMSSDGETRRAILLGYVVAWIGLVVALYLSPAYHKPVKRPFWLQVGDHYFFVMYSMIVMGAVTVYEWDLLFPDLLDVFVLSVLPMKGRRLFLARIVALVIFFSLVLLGTNSLGIVFLPLVADQPGFRVHLFAQAAAVLLGGTFSVALFLSLQGFLLNLLGQRVFRRVTPLLQGGSITVLLAILFAFPSLSHFLQILLSSGNPLVRCFPPFWFLGIYERILGGPSTLPIFAKLARYGCWATFLAIGLALITYPLAYRRRVKQLIEGPGAMNRKGWITWPINQILHATALRVPAKRAVFHFVSQTLFRTQKHRVLLAMYGGLGIALALAEMVILTAGNGHVRVGFLFDGICAAIPLLAFWTVAGLRTALAAPIDRRGNWIFRVVIGRATLEHLDSAKIMAAVWAFVVSMATLGALQFISPAELRTPLAIAGQIVIAVGISLLATDCLFLGTMAIPFTELHHTSITDMPLIVVRYFVVLPVLIFIIIRAEPWLIASFEHLVGITLMIVGTHLCLRWIYAERVREMRMCSEFEDSGELFQRLRLRE